MRVPAPEDFRSRLRSPAVAARVGLWLGVCFGLCFLTGLVSHYAQNPSQPVPFPTSPAWGYRVTQAVHVLSGTAAVPLLLVKLWTVYPRLFRRPSRDLRPLALEALERGSIGVLVAAAIFELASGLANATRWYPWTQFSFRTTHYAVAWVATGALLLHVAVKLPIIRDVLTTDVDATLHDRPSATRPGLLSRRGLLRTTWVAAGAAVVANAGASVPWLRRVSVFAVNDGSGPGGIPVNKTASEVGVTAAATASKYALEVVGPDRTVRLSLADLLGMPQHRERLPIACVEGWSASGTWRGPRLRDVLDLVGAPRGSDVRVSSMQLHGPFRVTTLPGNFADDDRTLLATELDGEPLALDHGYPCRLVAPNRPGVLQTKWLGRLEVLA